MRAHDWLAHWANVAPQRDCVVHAGRRWTYAETDRRANRFAHALRSLGVERGERFAVLARNCPEWLAVWCGASRAGAVPVPLNYRLHPSEWAEVVRDAEARVLIAQAGYVDAVESVRGDLGAVARTIAFGDDGEGTAGWDSLPALLDAAPATPPASEPPPTADDPLFQMYTSGTTGRPKGAVLSDRGIVANVCQYLPTLPVRAGDRVLVAMPMFHAGPALTCMAMLAAGATMHLMADFDPAECVRMLDEDGIVLAAFGPSMIQLMLEAPGVAQRRFERLQALVYGAAPIPAAVLERAIGTFGCGFIQVYGMTEASAVLASLSPADHVRALAGRPELLLSCGRPLAGTALRVVDADDRPLPVREVGEIVALGPQMMDGYWKRPDETRAALRGGWLHTGDAGYFDEEGYLFVSDRLKDVIISGAENIYPREVEDVLSQHPAVDEAAVIGVPDERWGEAVKAVVVARAGSAPTAEDLIAFCRERIAGYKRPRSVDFVAALPRNASGKVLKTELRAPYRSAAR